MFDVVLEVPNVLVEPEGTERQDSFPERVGGRSQCAVFIIMPETESNQTTEETTEIHVLIPETDEQHD
jgi:hypothetical protein